MEDIQSETMYKEYRIRRLDAHRLRDLYALYRIVFGMKLRKGYLEAKFSTAYTGAEYIGYIAYDPEGMPVAYYGVLPCLVRYDRQSILSAQSGDTMTHPRHQKKGLFVELSKMTFQLCRSERIRLIFGFPNQNAYPGMIGALGWTEVGTMERFTIPVRSFKILSGCLRHAGRRTFESYVRLILGKRLQSLKGLTNALLGQGYAGVDRNERYMQYKRYNNSYVITAGNALAWIRIKQGLVIGDMEVSDHQFAEAMRSMTKTARFLGLPYITFQTSRGTRLHAIFAARYHGETSFPVLIKDLGADIPPEKFAFTLADIDIF